MSSSRDVLVIGGGLAGLATAACCAQLGRKVTLVESRQKLGGRAASWTDRASGHEIDHCQHVAMGCCTNFLDFAQRMQIDDQFDRETRLHFFSPEGVRSDFAATPLVPAPLHLGTSFLSLSFLTLSDRISVARAVLALAREGARPNADEQSIGAWLAKKQQSQQAIERFWQVVLVSALGESLEQSSLASAQKVFVDGLLAHRRAGDVLIPKLPLRELFDERAAAVLEQQGVQIRRRCGVKRMEGDSSGIARVVLDSETIEASERDVVLAVPWHLAASLVGPMIEWLPELSVMERVSSSPISGVHLWLDRPITELRHAVLVGRLSQWLFAPRYAQQASDEGAREHYYQVVISASRNLAGRDREQVVGEVLDDLKSVFPGAREAKLLRWQLVTEQQAVFSVLPGLAAKRPAQATRVPRLFLAGDWTQTFWPATLEGAVRSGYLAAEAIARSGGESKRFLQADLPKNWLVRSILGDSR